MAGEHAAVTETRQAPTRSRPDLDSLRAGLARMRAGDAGEAVMPDPHEDDAKGDDTDDHGDEPAAGTKKPAAKPAKKPVAPPDDDEPDPDPDVPEDHEDDPDEATEDPEAAVADPEPEDEEPRPDPELERRAAALRKQDRRMRERAQREREEVTREREGLKSERAELESFKQLKARAKYDPTGVLRALGLSDDDLEPAARHIYAQTKEAQKDPKNRDAADRLMRERELQAKLDTALSRLDERDQREKQTAEREKQRREADRYIGSVQKAAKPGTLAAHYLGKGGKHAERATALIGQIAVELAEDEELPHPGDVLAEYERRRREELEDDGVDVAVLLKNPAAAANGKPATKPAAVVAPMKKPNGKPAVAAAREPLDPKRILDPEERKDLLLRDLRDQRRKRRLLD